MIKVIVIAGSAVSQAGLESVLKGTKDIEVVSSFFEVIDGMQMLEEDATDVVLVEGQDFATATWQQLADLRAEEPTAIIVLTHSRERRSLLQMLTLGVRGILPFSSSAAEIIAAVRAAAEGLVVFHTDIQHELFDPSLGPTPDLEREKIEPLTTREQEVLALLSQGFSNRAIAAQLYLSEHTVKFHISAIFEKLRVSSRTEAVAVGIRQGLVML